MRAALPVRLLVAAVAALVVGVLLAAPASAHTGLQRSDPADGAVLQALPATLTLTFTEPVRAGDVEVRGPAGAVPVDVTARGRDVVVDLRGATADPGSSGWAVDWSVTSRDGHDVAGSIGFTVDAPVVPTPAAAPAETPAATSTEAPAATPAAPAGPAASSGSGAVDALALVALLVGGVALVALLAGVLLGVPRLAALRQPAWWTAAAAGLVLLPLADLRATGRPLGDVTDPGAWLGGLLSWSGLAVVVVLVAASLAARAPRAAGDRRPRSTARA